MSNYYDRVMKRLEDAKDEDIIIGILTPSVINEISCTWRHATKVGNIIDVYFRGELIPLKEEEKKGIYNKYIELVCIHEKKKIDKLFEEL